MVDTCCYTLYDTSMRGYMVTREIGFTPRASYYNYQIFHNRSCIFGIRSEVCRYDENNHVNLFGITEGMIDQGKKEHSSKP